MFVVKAWMKSTLSLGFYLGCSWELQFVVTHYNQYQNRWEIYVLAFKDVNRGCQFETMSKGFQSLCLAPCRAQPSGDEMADFHITSHHQNLPPNSQMVGVQIHKPQSISRKHHHLCTNWTKSSALLVLYLNFDSQKSKAKIFRSRMVQGHFFLLVANSILCNCFANRMLFSNFLPRQINHKMDLIVFRIHSEIGFRLHQLKMIIGQN